MNDGKKIPFFFTAIPSFVFEKEFFQDIDYFRFICFAFSRTTFEKKIIVHHSQQVELEPLEFIFGRDNWSKHLKIKPAKVRTMICQLVSQQFASRVASKTASKFTVYKWLWKHFPTNFSQQFYQQVTSKTPANSPETKSINIRDKRKKAAAALYTEMPIVVKSDADFAAAAFLKNKELKDIFFNLPEEEREAILSLFHERNKTKEVKNPEGWLAECLKKSWHKQKRLQIVKDEKNNDFEANREYAKEIAKKYENAPNLHICVRRDFLEIGRSDYVKAQIFFCEASKTFRAQLKVAMQNLNME